MNSQQNCFFGAFVMTYQRPEILLKTIENIQTQTFPPELILVVDNSEDHDTEKVISQLQDHQIRYFRVGYNSGPAGAAFIGLSELVEMGFQWIYWGDDDNPSTDATVFEGMFRKIEMLSQKDCNPGIFGGKGAFFNTMTGRLRSLSNKQLLKGKTLEVDAVPGGHTMLVNANVVKKGIKPSKKLFFGFEEFDFCLRAKNAGFRIFIDAEKWLKTREKANNISKNYRWKASSFGNKAFLIREYYSSRNLLYVFFKNKYYSAFLFLLLKISLKMLLGFRHGWDYGPKCFKWQAKALGHFFTGKYGRLNSQPINNH